jgi:inhibitor of cysteine peptidase
MSTLITEKPTTVTTTKGPGNPDFWVNAGESFEIKLTENPTTGYIWALAQLPESFYLLSDSYQPDQPIKIGSGGTHRFYFVAMKPKIEGNFIFYQLRPWEPFAPIAESIWCVKVH